MTLNLEVELHRAREGELFELGERIHHVGSVGGEQVAAEDFELGHIGGIYAAGRNGLMQRAASVLRTAVHLYRERSGLHIY